MSANPYLREAIDSRIREIVAEVVQERSERVDRLEESVEKLARLVRENTTGGLWNQHRHLAERVNHLETATKSAGVFDVLYREGRLIDRVRDLESVRDELAKRVDDIEEVVDGYVGRTRDLEVKTFGIAAHVVKKWEKAAREHMEKTLEACRIEWVDKEKRQPEPPEYRVGDCVLFTCDPLGTHQGVITAATSPSRFDIEAGRGLWNIPAGDILCRLVPEEGS